MRRAGIALALALAACGSDEGREVASGTFDAGNGQKGEYSVRGDGEQATMRMKTEDGEMVVRSGQDGALPGGLPIYPGAKLASNATISGEGNVGGMAMLESADPPEKVAAFYRQAAERAGWKVESEFKSSGATMFGGPAGQGSNFSVTVSPGANGGSSAMVVMGKE